MADVLLIHGGFWSDDMDSRRFWHRTGIAGGLQERGLTVLAPDRLRRALSWAWEAERLVAALPERAVPVLAGSNGCSVAVRLALTYPDRVSGLVLAWPATAGDADRDTRLRRAMLADGARPGAVDGLLAGTTLRGATDAEIASLRVPVALVPADPENRAHRRCTIDALQALLPHAVELPGCPEPPLPDFPPHAGAFVDRVAAFVSGACRQSTGRSGIRA